MRSVNNVPDAFGYGTGYEDVYSPYDSGCSSNSAQSLNYEGTHTGTNFLPSKGTGGYSTYTFTINFAYYFWVESATDCSPHSTTDPISQGFFSVGGAIWDASRGWSAMNNTLISPYNFDTSGLSLSSCTSGGGGSYRGWAQYESNTYSVTFYPSLHYGDTITPRALWDFSCYTDATSSANSGDYGECRMFWDSTTGVISNGYAQVTSMSLS